MLALQKKWKRVSKNGCVSCRAATKNIASRRVDRAYEYSRGCIVEDELKPHVDATKLLFPVERGDYQVALEHVRRSVNNRIKFREHVLADTRQLIDEQGKTR